MSLEQGLLGGRKITAAEPDEPDLVQGDADGGRDESLQLIASPTSLVLGARLVAVEALRLRSIQATHAREAADVLALAPTVLGLDPLAGPLLVPDSRAGPDRRATDRAGSKWLDLAGDGRDSSFVDEGEPFIDPAEVDEGHALRAHGDRLEAAVLVADSQVIGATR